MFKRQHMNLWKSGWRQASGFSAIITNESLFLLSICCFSFEISKFVKFPKYFPLIRFQELSAALLSRVSVKKANSDLFLYSWWSVKLSRFSFANHHVLWRQDQKAWTDNLLFSPLLCFCLLVNRQARNNSY